MKEARTIPAAKTGSRNRLIAVASAGLVVIWLGFILLSLFDFASPVALAAFRDDAQFYGKFFTRVPRNAEDIIPVLLFLASGFGVGDLIARAVLQLRFRSLAGHLAVALCLGLACWTIAILAVGLPGFLNRAVLGTLLGGGLILTGLRLGTGWKTWRDWPRPGWPADGWQRSLIFFLAVLLVVNLYLAFLGALTPEVQFDARFYHLAEARRYAEREALFNLAASQGTIPCALPQNQETLYAAVYKLFGLHAVKVFSWSFLLLSVLAIFALASEFFGSRRAGLLANLLFVSTPIVTWSATTASNDLPLVPWVLLALYAALRWRETRSATAWLVLSGIFGGFAFGIKPFALFSNIGIAVLVVVAALRYPSSNKAQAARAIAVALSLFLAGALLGALPGMVRQYSITGNPLYPLAGGIIPSAFWSPALAGANAASIRAFGADASWSVLPVLPWVLTMQAVQYRNLIGPFFLFTVPFILLYALRKGHHPLFRQILLFLAVWIILWFCSGYIEARYAESVYPLLTLLAAFLAMPSGAPGLFPHPFSRRTYLVALVVIAIVNMQFFVPWQRDAMNGHVSGRIPFLGRYLYDNQSERDVQLALVPMIEYLNRNLVPKKDKVFLATDDVYYALYSDIDLFDGYSPHGNLLRHWNLFSADAVEQMRAVGASHVVIEQNQETPLQNAPLRHHLTEIARIHSASDSSGRPGRANILYRLKK